MEENQEKVEMVKNRSDFEQIVLYTTQPEASCSSSSDWVYPACNTELWGQLTKILALLSMVELLFFFYIQMVRYLSSSHGGVWVIKDALFNNLLGCCPIPKWRKSFF